MKKRENNYDLLRIICSIAVISIHVSSTYQKIDNINGIYILLYNILSRFAVPCFLMLSGAFIISNNKNKQYKSVFFENIPKRYPQNYEIYVRQVKS